MKAAKLALQAIENANNIDENNLKLVFNKKRPEEKKNNDKM
jgi:DNA polymerase III delta prime subunit